MTPELGRPLDFNGDTNFDLLPESTPEIDVISYAESASGDGFNIMSWGESSRKLLHHHQMYSPSRFMTAAEYYEQKENGVS